MPNRTKKARRLIDSLPIKTPDKYCNARTPTGYCKHTAGWKTTHKGVGRCTLHGGSAGRNPSMGIYSRNMQSTVKKEFEKLANHPMLVNLYSELALTKALLSNLLKKLEDKMDDPDFNWFVQRTKRGKVISAEASTLLRIMETMTKIYGRIVDADKRAQEQLSVKDIYIIIQQIKVSMDDICGSCPVRKSISQKISNTKMANVVSTEEANVISEE